MDKDINNVRVEERIKIKIGEAKNLVPNRSHVSAGHREIYCSLSLDQEEIFRTATVERSLSPFFGEEFQFEVPRKFRYLALYIYEQERSSLGGRGAKPLGKVAIKREDLHKYHGKDHWFPILPVDADSEVQGKVHVNIKWDHCLLRGSAAGPHSAFRRLAVRIIECSDLTIIHGACDPYVTVTLYHHNLHETKKTKVRKKTTCPHFDEVLYFDLPIKGQNHDRYSLSDLETYLSSSEIRVNVMHDSATHMFGGMFLGEVRIPLRDIGNGHNAWYFLLPRSNPARSLGTGDNLGTLRLKICYNSDHVFSSHFYDPLRQLLLDSPDVEPVTSSAAYVLGELVANKVEAAQPLTKVFLHHGKLVPLIRALADAEIAKVTDPNTIFRGNTLVSKCMDECMKILGMNYLHQTLKPLLDQIFTERKCCEIDPTRLKEHESLQANLDNLVVYCEKAVQAITSSAYSCPSAICAALGALRAAANHHFPGSQEVQFSVVSGFIFLRFFAAAILGPKLFGLAPPHPLDTQVNRTLTLISKAVQCLGNLVSSKTPLLQNFKEDYMIHLYKRFIKEEHIHSVGVFLDLVSSCSSQQPLASESPVVLKEGMLIKRAQGRRKFGFKNFRKRYFCLTTSHLFYAKTKGAPPLCFIPVNKILAVEKVQEDSFKMKNMFQVIHGDQPLYVQASNCVEEKSWLDALHKVCRSNVHRLDCYHPGAYLVGAWTCCKDSREAVPGCTPVSLTANIDSDREMERIHTIFFSHLETLDSLLEVCEGASSSGESSPLQNGSGRGKMMAIEDPQTLWETLKRIRSCVIRLEQDHKQHLTRICRQTQYGSKQAPIGDDNYLMLIAQHCK